MTVQAVLHTCRPRPTAFAALAFLIACDPTGPASGRLEVTTTTTTSSVLPGDKVLVTVQASPAPGVVAEAIHISSTGLLSVAESVLAPGPGVQSASWTFTLPFAAGAVVFTGRARAGELIASSQATIVVEDSVPPTFTSWYVSPEDQVSAGTQLFVALTATDNSGIGRSIIQWSESLSGSDSAEHAFPKLASRSLYVPVPATTPLGDSISVLVKVVDAAGNEASQTSPWIHVIDGIRPTVTGTVTTPPIIVPGDTVTFTVTGRDQVRVRWVGYRLGGAANTGDSVSVSDTLASHTFAQVVPNSWIGLSEINLFARDAGDNTDELYQDRLTVIDAIRRPMTVVPLGSPQQFIRGPITDLAYDRVRNRLYLSSPYDSLVAIVALDPPTLVGYLRLGTPPHGLDLTPSADTLLVALNETPYVGIVDLTQPTLTADTVRLFGVTNGPDRLRAMANGKAFVTISDYGFGSGIWEYDLQGGTSNQRNDMGLSGLTSYIPLVRSLDAQRLVALRDMPCCSVGAFVYDAQTDAFVAVQAAVAPLAKLSSDSTGTRYLIGTAVLDGSLTTLTVLDPPNAIPSRGTAISPNGQNAYVATSYGYVKVRVSDGAILDRVAVHFDLPMTEIMVLPGEATMVLVAWSFVGVISLQ